MLHETVKWKLFSFSLMVYAKEWYSLTVGWVEGDWNILKEKFYLHFFPLRWVMDLCIEVVSFKQREEEPLGEAWACYTELISSGLDLGMPEAMHL
jgi:hypothetical protein